jgi:hypothetical protein
VAVVLPFSFRVAETLREIPAAGETHRWLARAAAGLQASGCVSREACGRFLRDCCGQWVAHRAVPEREIEAALRLAYDTPRTPGERRPRASWPSLDASDRDTAAWTAPALFDGVTDTGLCASDVLPVLFGTDELVCAGWVCERPVVRRCREWLPRAGAAQFIAPNPMKGPAGLTREGRRSARCQDNVAERRYVVAEFDDAAFGKPEQARVASALNEALPLVLAVDSGGKSLHGWFDCRGRGDDEVAAFFAAATRLGADRTRWDPCGWVRMPGGTRVKPDGRKVKQKVLWMKRKETQS